MLPSVSFEPRQFSSVPQHSWCASRWLSPPSPSRPPIFSAALLRSSSAPRRSGCAWVFALSRLLVRHLLNPLVAEAQLSSPQPAASSPRIQSKPPQAVMHQRVVPVVLLAWIIVCSSLNVGYLNLSLNSGFRLYPTASYFHEIFPSSRLIGPRSEQKCQVLKIGNTPPFPRRTVFVSGGRMFVTVDQLHQSACSKTRKGMLPVIRPDRSKWDILQCLAGFTPLAHRR